MSSASSCCIFTASPLSHLYTCNSTLNYCFCSFVICYYKIVGVHWTKTYIFCRSVINLSHCFKLFYVSIPTDLQNCLLTVLQVVWASIGYDLLSNHLLVYSCHCFSMRFISEVKTVLCAFHGWLKFRHLSAPVTICFRWWVYIDSQLTFELSLAGVTNNINLGSVSFECAPEQCQWASMHNACMLGMEH